MRWKSATPEPNSFRPGVCRQAKSNVRKAMRFTIEGAHGSPFFSMEAMKMENAVSAERDGAIARVRVVPGDRIEAKDLLLEFEGTPQ